VIWKLNLNENLDGYDNVETTNLNNGLAGPAWRFSWSLSGNMLAVSTQAHNNDNKVYVFSVK